MKKKIKRKKEMVNENVDQLFKLKEKYTQLGSEIKELEKPFKEAPAGTEFIGEVMKLTISEASKRSCKPEMIKELLSEDEFMEVISVLIKKAEDKLGKDKMDEICDLEYFKKLNFNLK